MRKRTLLANNIDVEISVADAVACDVVFYNPKEDRLVIRRKQSSYRKEETPVGIVVIPASHNVYGNGACGVMSLMSASCYTPDTGSTSNQSMGWGQLGTDISELYNYDECVYSRINGNDTGTAQGTKSLGSSVNLPSDNFSASQCSTDPTAYYKWDDNNPCAPSPYLIDGSRNPAYYQTTSPSSTKNCLSDFKGKENTAILISKATAQLDWKTASSITDTIGSGYSPAACACWRYYTEGTKQGDWYLPAMGELGYACVRLKKVNEIITTLQSHFGKIFCLLDSDDGYFSSSENGSISICRIYFSYGGVNLDSKGDRYYVRPFMQLKQDYIDMGLSVKWATCNIGASKPEEYGYYFQWGGLTPYNSDRTPVGGGKEIIFDFSSCPYCAWDDEYQEFRWLKYYVSDGKLVLDLEDDAAHVHIGDDCRMPTKEECQELFDTCDIEWKENYNNTGINGVIFTLKSDSAKTLFFPASGEIAKFELENLSEDCYYWLSSLDTSNSNREANRAAYWYFDISNGPKCSYSNRYLGRPIRAVKPKVPDTKVLPNGIYGFHCNTAFPTGPDDTNIQYLIECPICKVENGSIYLYGTSKPVAFEVSGARIGGNFVETYSPTFYSVSYRDDALNTMRSTILSCLRNLGYGVMRMDSGTGCLLEELYTDDFSKITILGDGKVDGPSKE